MAHHLALVPSPRRTVRGMTTVAHASWVMPLEQWGEWMCAADRPQTTRDLRTYQVRRFARDTGLEPWMVTLDDLVSWLGRQTWATSTKRSYRTALRCFYSWAHLTGRIGTNPAWLLPAIKIAIHPARPAPEAVLAAGLLAASDRVRLMVLLAAKEGLRRGEIARVHTDDVELDALGTSLRVHGKGRRERLVPLCDEVRILLSEAPMGYLFPGQINGHLSPAHVGKLVSRVLAPSWTAHSLRHRCATKCYAEGRDLLAVQRILGHAKPETTQQYVLIPDSFVRAALAGAA